MSSEQGNNLEILLKWLGNWHAFIYIPDNCHHQAYRAWQVRGVSDTVEVVCVRGWFFHCSRCTRHRTGQRRCPIVVLSSASFVLSISDRKFLPRVTPFSLISSFPSAESDTFTGFLKISTTAKRSSRTPHTWAIHVTYLLQWPFVLWCDDLLTRHPLNTSNK